LRGGAMARAAVMRRRRGSIAAAASSRCLCCTPAVQPLSLLRRARLRAALQPLLCGLCAASPVELLQQIDVHVCWVATL